MNATDAQITELFEYHCECRPTDVRRKSHSHDCNTLFTDACRDAIDTPLGSPERARVGEFCARQRGSEEQRLRMAIWCVIDAFEGAVANFESRGKGGQQVLFTGDFASMPPSAAGQMRRWARDLRQALDGTWPMLREEFVKAYGTTDSKSLDYMFRERKT